MENNAVLKKYNGSKLAWLHSTIRFIILIAVLFVLFRFVIGLSLVGGTSMEPALQDGTVVLYLRTLRSYAPGDIVSMRVPSGDYYVKRVVAVGGDIVELPDGEVWVNGVPAADPWGNGETVPESGAVIYPYQIRSGNVFVLGDNRTVSMDSRAFGEVNTRQIKGKIVLRFGKDGIHRVKGETV